MRHIVGVPNHVRIWRRSFYEKINQHNSLLPVVDDYELIIRTFLESKNWVRIPECLYFQYQNNNNNNFTNHRNKLIQYLTKWTSYYYEQKIKKRFEEIGWKYEIINEDTTWERNYFENKFFGEMYDIFEEDLTIIIPIDFENKGEEYINEIKDLLLKFFEQTDQSWKIYLIANKNYQITEIINWILTDWKIFAKKIDWWNMDEKVRVNELLNYILKLYITNSNLNRYVSYIKPSMKFEKNFIQEWKENKVKEFPNRKGIYGMIHQMKLLEDYLWSEDDCKNENIDLL
jgi:hypothetical protein